MSSEDEDGLEAERGRPTRLDQRAESGITAVAATHTEQSIAFLRHLVFGSLSWAASF